MKGQRAEQGAHQLISEEDSLKVKFCFGQPQLWRHRAGLATAPASTPGKGPFPGWPGLWEHGGARPSTQATLHILDRHLS